MLTIILSFPQPPVMCPQQEASYILSFDDGEEEEWSRDPVEIESSGASVEVILDTDKEPCLKRERNYTLRVTLVTEYANVSSQTDFSKRKKLIQLIVTLCSVSRYRVSEKFSRSSTT